MVKLDAKCRGQSSAAAQLTSQPESQYSTLCVPAVPIVGTGPDSNSTGHKSSARIDGHCRDIGYSVGSSSLLQVLRILVRLVSVLLLLRFVQSNYYLHAFLCLLHRYRRYCLQLYHSYLYHC